MADEGYPDIPDLPDLPDVFDEHPAGHECPVCQFLEEKVCKPNMKHGDPHQCALDIKQVREENADIPREERVKKLSAVFDRYGIDPNARLGA